MEVDAVITISPFCESPQLAIKSILKCKNEFANLHLVQVGYDTEKEFYPGFQDDLKKFDNVVWHSKFDAAAAEGLMVIHCPPELEFTQAAIASLKSDMTSNYVDHAAVDPSLIMRERDLLSIFMYGFLVALLVLDYSRSFFGAYFTNRQLRAQAIERHYPKFGTLKRQNRCCGNSISARDLSGGCKLLPESGGWYVVKAINTHSQMGLGLWYFTSFFYWVMMLWFVRALVNLDYTFITFDVPMIFKPLLAMFIVGGIGFYLGAYIICAIVILGKVAFPFTGLFYLAAFPFYASLFPFVFIYARYFHSSKASWN